MLTPIRFAEQSYLDDSRPINAQRLINAYLEPSLPSSKGALPVKTIPGFRLFSSVGTGPIRGCIDFNEELYVVSGNEFYKVDLNGVATLYGGITGNRHVVMSKNDTQIAIVSDFDAFYFDGIGIGTLSVNDLVGVATLDNYGVFAERDTQAWFISANNNFTSFNPLETALANAYPDKLKAITRVNREIVLFGERSAEFWINSGQVDFPFTRVPSGILERGCLATHSVVSYQGTVFWLGDDKVVYALNGYQPMPISTYPINAEIETFQYPEEAVAFAYAMGGHIFYVLTFPEKTYCYDLTTQKWHERKSFYLDYWRAKTHCYVYGENIVGDGVNGNLYVLDPTEHDENGDPIRVVMTAPPLHADGHRAHMESLFIDMQTGVGVQTGQGSDPQAMLDWSDDGGYTWSSEHWRSMGAQGDRRTTVHWHRLGQFRQRTLRMTITDPVKRTFIGAYAELERGGE